MKSFSLKIAQTNVIIFTASQMILFSLLPFLAEKSNLALVHLTLAFSTGSFLFLFTSPLWGHLSDKWGRSAVISIGVCGLFIANLCTATMMETSFPLTLLWIGRILYGLSASAIVPVTQALLVEQSPDKPPLQALLKNSIALNIGRAAGPAYLLASSLVFWNIKGSLWGLVLICGLLSFFNIKNIQIAKTVATSPLDFRLPRFSGTQKNALLVGFLFSTFVGALNAGLAHIFIKRLHLDSLQAGSLMAQVLLASALLAVAVQFTLKRLTNSPLRGLLLTGSLCLLLGGLLLSQLHSFWQLPFVVVFLAVGLCTLPPCYTGIIAQGTQAVGLRTSIVGILSTLGYAVGGGLLSFFLWQNLQVETLLTGLTLGLFIYIFFWIIRQTKEFRHDHL